MSTMKAPRRPERVALHTDPAIVREALNTAESTTLYAASKQTGHPTRTIERWVEYRQKYGPSWPTDQDIADWRADKEENGPLREYLAARHRRYRVATYLNRGPLLVDSIGTTRRLQALHAMGWTTADLASRLASTSGEAGVSSQRVSHLMRGIWAKVHPRTAEAVAEVYDQLSMIAPQDKDPVRRGEIRLHKRARGRAKRLGYLPPLAWDDIDDPNEQPRKGSNERHRDDIDEAVILRILDGDMKLAADTTIAEKFEVMRRWLATGRSEKALCEATGWKSDRYTPARAEAS